MPPTAAPSAPLGRRAFVRLAARAGGVVAGTVALAACGVLDRVPAPRPRRADADEPLVSAALADQQRVLAAVLAAAAAQPQVATALERLIEHHRVHVQVLGGAPDATPSASASASPSPSAAPGSPAATLARVRALELAASRARVRDAGRAASGDLARVLAAMAAGQAQHVVLLDRAAGALR